MLVCLVFSRSVCWVGFFEVSHERFARDPREVLDALSLQDVTVDRLVLHSPSPLPTVDMFLCIQFYFQVQRLHALVVRKGLQTTSEQLPPCHARARELVTLKQHVDHLHYGARIQVRQKLAYR